MDRTQPKRPVPRRLILAHDIEAKAVSWMWEGWLAWGKLFIWEGDPDVGKSLVTVDLAARATTGQDMPDGSPGQEAAALMLCAEDDFADTVKPRLVAAGADLRRVALLELSRRRDAKDLLALPRDLQELRGSIVRLKRTTGLGRAVVVIDPITAFLDSDMDANRDTDVRRLTTVLGRMAAEVGCVIVLVRHLNKAVQVSSAKHRGSGSIGWTAAARGVAIFGNHPKDADLKVMASTKNNLAQRPSSLSYRLKIEDGAIAPRVDWCGSVDLRADDLVRPDSRKQAPQRDTAIELLRRLLDEGGGRIKARTAMAAGRKNNISDASMKRAADELGLARIKEQSEDSKLISMWAFPAVPGGKRGQGEQS